MEWENAVKDILGILKEIQQDNKEIKEDVKQIREDIKNNTDKIYELHKKVEKLEIENQELKGKLLQTQKKNIKNNIIIFGIPEAEDAGKFFIRISKDKLEIDLNETDINNIYRIGLKKDNKPRAVILELVRNTKKQEIFRNITKLKGTGISLSNDLLKEERKQQKLIYKHYKLAKEKQYQVKLIKNKLIINGEEYTYDKLKKAEEEEENDTEAAIRKNNSAPATPNQNYTYTKELGNQHLEGNSKTNKQKQERKNQEEKGMNTLSTPNKIADPKQKSGNTLSKPQLSQGVLTRKQLQTQNVN